MRSGCFVALIGTVLVGYPLITVSATAQEPLPQEVPAEVPQEDLQVADQLKSVEALGEGFIQDYVSPKGYKVWAIYLFARTPGRPWFRANMSDRLSPALEYRLIFHHGHIRLNDLPEFFREDIELRVVYEGLGRKKEQQESLVFYTDDGFHTPLPGQHWRTVVRRPGPVQAIDPSVLSTLYFKMTEVGGRIKAMNWNVGFYMKNHWRRWNGFRRRDNRWIER